MIVEPYPQMPFGDRRESLSPLIERIVLQAPWREITGIFAYSTASGLLELLRPIESLSPKPSLRWLFGMDDCLTEPGAISLAQTTANIVCVVSLLNAARRFHPKVLHFASIGNMTDVTIIGSANLTLNGLTKNAEAITILRTESPADVSALQNLTARLFSLGHEPTAAELDEYRKAYKAARPHHRRVARLARQVSRAQAGVTGEHTQSGAESTSPGLDPTVATRCWIEVGKNTAQGRELEIKAEQALFFGLHHSAGDRQARTFRLSDGSTIPMNFKYQGNAMWRLQMRNEVPEVRHGLRPLVHGRLQRSLYVAVFERTKGRNTFTLRFVNERSSTYRRLKRDAELNGTAGHTTARQYGWS